MLYRRLATLAVLGSAHCFPQSVAPASSPHYSRRDELVDINRRQGLGWLDQALTRRSFLSEIEDREIDDEYHFFERSTGGLFDHDTLLFARAFGLKAPPVPPKPESLRSSSITPQAPATGGSSTTSPPSRPPVPAAPAPGAPATGANSATPPPAGRPPVPVAPVPGAPATGANSAPPPPSRPPPPVPGAPSTPGTGASSAPPSRPPPPAPGAPPTPATGANPAPPSSNAPPTPGSQLAPGTPGYGRQFAPNLHPEGGVDWVKKVQDDSKASKGGSSPPAKDPTNPVPNLEKQAAQRAHDKTGFSREESDATDIEDNKAGIRNKKMAEIDKMNAAELTNYNNKMKYFNTGKDVATVGIAGTVASHTLGLLRRELAKREVLAREAYALYLSLGEDELY